MDDLVSRQGAIDAWDKLSKRGRTEFDQVLMTLPSAEPKTKCVAQIRRNRDDIEDLVNEIIEKVAEPKIGKWVEVEKNEYEGFSIVNMRCNQCGRYAYLVLPKGTQCVYDYCPWCKTDMRGKEE